MVLKSDLTERMSFEPIRYSQVWEDYRLLERAFKDASVRGGEIFSVASAGCNVLALLTMGARRLTAIDLSRSQLSLCELKYRAALSLEATEIRELLVGGDGALRLYQICRAQLSPPARAYWDAREAELLSGISQCGMLEKYFAKFRELALVPSFAPAGGLEGFGRARDLAEQKELYASADRGTLRAMAAKFFSREALEKQGRDPEQFRYARDRDLGLHFFQKFEKSVLSQWIGDNPYLKFILTGELGNLPYLTAEGLAAIKASKTELVFELCDLESLLSDRPDASISAANLSDIFEYMSDAHADQVFELLSRKLARDGRIGFWNLLVDRKPSPGGLRLLETLSEELSAEDRVWLYECFRVCQRD